MAVATLYFHLAPRAEAQVSAFYRIYFLTICMRWLFICYLWFAINYHCACKNRLIIKYKCVIFFVRIIFVNWHPTKIFLVYYCYLCWFLLLWCFRKWARRWRGCWRRRVRCSTWRSPTSPPWPHSDRYDASKCTRIHTYTPHHSLRLPKA